MRTTLGLSIVLTLFSCQSTSRLSRTERILGSSPDAPLVVAHRGNSSAFPENTLPAFQSAVRQRSQIVELDFFESSDGVLFCMHDKTLDRTTDAAARLGKRKIATGSLPMARLAELDAGSWKSAAFAGTRIPTLARAIDAILPTALPMIEHKAGSARRLVELLRRKGVVDSVLVQSFDWEWLADVAALEPRLALAALGSGELDAKRLRKIAALGVRMVHWKSADLSASDVHSLHGDGYLVCVYTANDAVDLMRAVAIGCDAITTDHPARLTALNEVRRR